MEELIKITKNHKGTSVVSARELYDYLQVKTEFPKWCERMFEYGFIENKDYARVVVINDDNSKGGRSTLIDYALTVDTSKEISMVQRTEQGKKARQYFIACEKLALSPKVRTHLEVIQSEMALLIDNQKKDALLLQANTKIELDKPKVVFADSVIGSKNSVLIRQFAKDLCTDDFKIGQKKVFDFLKDNKYINLKLEPYQKYVDLGVFEVITRTVGSGEETFASKTTKITGKGAVYFAEKIKNQNNG